MLELVDLKKSFAGNQILKGINLTLFPGEFCIILGSNGSGKSTLLRAIAGDADSGKVKAGKIAYVTQDVNKGTIAQMSMLENVILSQISGKQASLKLYEKRQQEITQMIAKLGLGLEAFINQPLGDLSGGQRQVIATLMAFNSSPQLLLLDEHTSALDPRMQKFLMKYTAEYIAKNKITSLMVTHKLEDALHFGDSLIMLDKGQIIFTAIGKKKKDLSLDQLHELFYQCEVNHV